MKLQTFRIDKETEQSVKAILKLKRPKVKKGTYYRTAIQKAVEDDKIIIQMLATEMNSSKLIRDKKAK